MSFPTELSNAIDGVTEVIAAHLNNLEAKVGIDHSAVPTSLDYLLRNTASIDPGHKHSKLWASDGSPEAMTVEAAGNVGIGTTSPGAKLDVNGIVVFSANTAGKNTFEFSTSAIDEGRLRIKNVDTITVQIRAGGDTYFNGGNVGIGTTSPGYKLTCNGEPGANGYTAWTNFSDVRFKQDIKPLNGDILAKMLKLNPVTFSYNDKNPWKEKPGERTLYGFIAQELQELFPDMVGDTKGPDGEKYLTTNLSNLTLYLVQAIKEQQAQIEALQTKLN